MQTDILDEPLEERLRRKGVDLTWLDNLRERQSKATAQPIDILRDENGLPASKHPLQLCCITWGHNMYMLIRFCPVCRIGEPARLTRDSKEYQIVDRKDLKLLKTGVPDTCPSYEAQGVNL